MIYWHFQNHCGRIVLLSCDIHGSMAAGIRVDPSKYPPRAQSLASEAEIKQHLNHAKFVNLDGHGYTIVEATPEGLQVEFVASRHRALPLPPGMLRCGGSHETWQRR